MPYPVAAGGVDYSSSGVTGLTPTLFGKYFLDTWQSDAVLQYISTGAYTEGLGSPGDAIEYSIAPLGTIRTHLSDQELIVGKPQPTKKRIELAHQRYLAESMPIVALDESNLPVIKQLMTQYTQQMALNIENYILNNLATDVDASNKGNAAGVKTGGLVLGATGSPVTWSPSTAVNLINRCGVVLAEQNCPKNEWVMVIPPLLNQALKESDFANASVTGERSTLRMPSFNGVIGGFEIYTSNQYDIVTDGGDTCFNVYFGRKSALGYVHSVVKNQVVKSDYDSRSFNDVVKLLYKFGFELVYPKGAGILYAKAG